MTNYANMLRVAEQALHDRADWRHALKLARQIVVNDPDSEEAIKAQAIIDDMGDKADRVPDLSDEVYTEEQWASVKGKPATGVSSVESKYSTALGVAGLIEFVGWLAVAAGVIAVFVTVGKELGPVGYLTGFVVVFSGLMTIMGAQVVKATVDISDNTRAILTELKSQR